VPAAAAALGRLAARGIQAVLLVAGRGRAADVRRAAGRAGTGRLRLLGVVDDLRPLYAAADVFVLPSVYDPASNATLEAMAMGLPVVTSATNGSSELIDPGRSGWVLGDAGNAEVLAGMLEEAADPARRRAVGEAGRRAVEPWTWERHLDAMLALCTPGG
jgi:UDP-glucose:(heptosyl)LPS alpha-1,3-glucosyltransferase